MVRLFAKFDATVCRACGASHGYPSDPEAPQDICGDCWGRFVSWCRYADHVTSEDHLNQWLARQLFLSVRRLKIYGVTGRCEAITGGQNIMVREGASSRGGYQCAMHASMMRDGHRVCASHGQRANFVTFVDSRLRDQYRDFTRLMADLAVVDPEFLDCIKEAAECADALAKPKTDAAA